LKASGKLLAAFYPRGEFQGDPVDRTDSCMVCHSSSGILIAKAAFWDLQDTTIVKCPDCDHIQLDPVLSDPAVEVGCNAYFAFESMNETVKNSFRNRIRNYRRGVLFASNLKRRGFHPREILEFGPGSGYFSKGIQHIFPSSQVTVVDIVDGVLEFNKRIHHFRSIHATPVSIATNIDHRYDLIIARDILEHVSDIRVMLRNVSELLNAGGLFHFLTPNGLEDVWGHTVLWKLKQQPAELRINHISYFDGQCLKKLLEEYELEAVSYYTYQVKSVIKYGKGWRMKEQDASASACRSSASGMIRKFTESTGENIDAEAQFTLPWYLRTKHTRITVFICWYHHRVVLKFPPELNLGHEIYGLFRLRAQSTELRAQGTGFSIH